MLLFFPFLGWLAAATSAVMLAMLHLSGGLTPGRGAAFTVCLLLALYCQFFVASPMIAAGGLTLQTLLAIYLIMRWRLGG